VKPRAFEQTFAMIAGWHKVTVRRLDGPMDTSSGLPGPATGMDETLLATTRYLQALTLLDDGERT
jgi:hypothetical protein